MFPWSRVREDVLQQVKKLPRPFTADDVLSIYRMTQFSDLPFEKLGFRSIHDFLASFPNFVVVDTPGGICYNVVKIDALTNENNEKEDGECDTDDEGEEPLRFNGGDEVLTGRVGTVKRENSNDYVEILSAADTVIAPSGDTAVASNMSTGSVENLVAAAVCAPSAQPVINHPASEENQVSTVADSERSSTSGVVSDSGVLIVDEQQGVQEVSENEASKVAQESQAVVVATPRRSSSLFQSVSGYIKGCFGLMTSKNSSGSGGKQNELKGKPNPSPEEPLPSDPIDACAVSSIQLENMTFDEILLVRFVAAIYEKMATKGNLGNQELASIVGAYPPFKKMLDKGGRSLVERINRCSRVKIRKVSDYPFTVGSAYEKEMPPGVAAYLRAVYEEDQRRLNVARARFIPIIPALGSIPHSTVTTEYFKKYGKALDDVERHALTGCAKTPIFFDRLLDEENPKFLHIPTGNHGNYARSSKERLAAFGRTKEAMLELSRANRTRKGVSAAKRKMWKDFEKNILSVPLCRSELIPVDAIPLPPVSIVLPSKDKEKESPMSLPVPVRISLPIPMIRRENMKRTAAPPTASADPLIHENGVPLIYADEYKKLEKEMLDMATFPSAEILTFDEILLMKAAIHLILILDTDGGTAKFPSPITEDVRLHLATKIVIKKYGVDDFIKRTAGTPFEIEKICSRPLTLRNFNYGKMTQAIAEFAAAILLEDDKRLDDAREQFLELLPSHPGSMSFSAVSSIYATRFHRELDASERKLITGVEDEVAFLLRLQGDSPQNGKLVAFIRDKEWHLMVSVTSKTHLPQGLELQLTEAKRRIAYTLKQNCPITFDRLNEAHRMKYNMSLDENERRRYCGYGSIVVFCERIRTERIYGEILYARRGHKFYMEKPKPRRECMPPSPKRKRVEVGEQDQQQVTESAATTDPNPTEQMEVVASSEVVPDQEAPPQDIVANTVDQDSSILILREVRRRRCAARVKSELNPPQTSDNGGNPQVPTVTVPPPPSAAVVAGDVQGSSAAKERLLSPGVNLPESVAVVEGEQQGRSIQEPVQPTTEHPADRAVANRVDQQLQDGGNVAVDNNSGGREQHAVKKLSPRNVASVAAPRIKKQQDVHSDEKFVLCGQMVTAALREAQQRGEDTDAIMLRTLNTLYGK